MDFAIVVYHSYPDGSGVKTGKFMYSIYVPSALIRIEAGKYDDGSVVASMTTTATIAAVVGV